MKPNAWKYIRIAVSAAGLVGVLVSCNSHLLIEAKTPEVVTIDPPPAPPPPPTIDLNDAGLTTVTFPPVTLGDLPDGAVPDAPVQPGTDAPIGKTPDAATIKPDLGPDIPPPETLSCPKGQVRVHVRDLWSSKVSPTMSTLTSPPIGVIVIDPSGSWTKYGARLDGTTDIDGNPPCTYYSVCIPTSVTKIEIQPIGADACPAGNPSGAFDISQVSKNPEFWIEYTGSSSTLSADYTQSPVPTGSGKFHLATSASALTSSKACKVGTPPDESAPSGFTKVHFRWPWNDPTNPATPYAGSACPIDVATKLGFTPPPYPSSLKVTGVGSCEMTALLEYQDGTCPWYYVMVPNADWPATGTAPQIVFRYPDESKGLFTNGIQLPARGSTSEFWIAYAGAPDNKSPPSATVCNDWSLQTNSYFIYTANPGPGCAGSTVTVDPCNPPQPSNYHTIHFRYIWAGQKTFTFFPKPSFMPKWIEMEVTAASTLKVICWREQDRPWFECPVPDSYFTATTTWRAVDKTHTPEWNTVTPRTGFPTKPGDYWLRWYYGKPDTQVPTGINQPQFKFFDYYPDGTNGDWSATGVWNDSACAPKPPATPVTVGFGNGAWFPYARTQYKYQYGMSLAYIYPDAATVQDLFNAFVWERYQIWKQNYIIEGSNACGDGTARVHTDPPETVSEGQGYGMAIAAAIGDKDLVGKLWLFVRHYLSQSAKKYCGGLMGWMWQGTSSCRALDSTCDTSAGEGCGGIGDSAFDGDVDIAIGLVYAAMQWPNDKPPQSSGTWKDAAVDWLTKMECEVDAAYDGQYNYPAIGDTDIKDCSGQPGKPCVYSKGQAIKIRLDYYPPGYFRAFGDFLDKYATSGSQASNGQSHKDFWYRTAQTVYKMLEQCYDATGVNPGLVGSVGDIPHPCATASEGTYEELRSLWRVGIDAAWSGNNTSLPENGSNSSSHYAGKTQMQAKIDNSQEFFNNFSKKNPVEANANRFSSICQGLDGSGTVTGCDPALGHNGYTVNMGMCSYVSLFDDGGKTTSDIRREAVEEAISTTIENDRYFQESLGVYSDLFLTGNFPNPMTVPAN
jgi:Glycosyl hydrolases family 8